MNYQVLANYIRTKGKQVLIEVEGLEKPLTTFIADYNHTYGHSVTMASTGIRKLHPNADKWAVEYRVYFQSIEDFPEEFLNLVKGNRTYYPDQFPYRINNKDVVKGLFDNGFELGFN